MRDPFQFSIPLWTLFRVRTKVHLVLPVLMLGFIGNAATDDHIPGTWVDAVQIMGILFFSVYFHELGHCFAARWVGGEADEVLLWPLGGLASCNVPHTPRANLITALGGPAVNLVLCVVAAIGLALVCDASYQPPWNPFWKPYRQFASGAMSTLRLWDGSSPGPVDSFAPLFLARVFWLNWIMSLFNMLLPGFPLDGGRVLQSLTWPFVGYRQATLYAIFAGFGVMIVLGICTVVFNTAWILLLAIFIFVSCKTEYMQLESGNEDSPFGYDFSQGYTSLEREERQAAPTKPRKNFIARWLERRNQLRAQQEAERQESDERRMDLLLEKLHQSGKESLTDEEKRFMKRFSERYKRQ